MGVLGEVPKVDFLELGQSDFVHVRSQHIDPVQAACSVDLEPRGHQPSLSGRALRRISAALAVRSEKKSLSVISFTASSRRA